MLEGAMVVQIQHLDFGVALQIPQNGLTDRGGEAQKIIRERYGAHGALVTRQGPADETSLDVHDVHGPPMHPRQNLIVSERRELDDCARAGNFRKIPEFVYVEIDHKHVAFVICQREDLSAFIEAAVDEPNLLRVFIGVVHIDDQAETAD
jgi:hypothetical protein